MSSDNSGRKPPQPPPSLPQTTATSTSILSSSPQPPLAGPSSSSSSTAQPSLVSSGPPPNLSNEQQWAVFINQRMSGMPNATSLPEWQLQAVLFHAKLTPYYERFISLGGDDIDQLMQCDETEFLEIMRLIGMASKPLHVRRFQRSLADFSKDRANFLRQAAIHIGPPPAMGLPTSSQTSSLQAALQFLIPDFTAPTTSEPQQHTTSSLFPSASSASSSSAASTSAMLASTTLSESLILPPRLYPQPSTLATIPFFNSPPSLTTTAAAAAIGGISATANILTSLPSSDLLNLVGQQPPPLASSTSSMTNLNIPSISPSVIVVTPTPLQSQSISGGQSSSRTESPAAIAGPSGGCGSNQSIASPVSDTEYQGGDPFEGGVLPESDIPQIIRQSKILYSKKPELHSLEPRFVQNKKKLPKELLDVMNLPMEDKNRLTEFRRFSAIYGRYDAKRKPDRPLSYHELLVNEAAAQLCLLQPVLLTRRDELFPLARQVVRELNFPAFRTLSRGGGGSGSGGGERKRPYDSKSERSASPHSVASNRSDSPELERRASSSNPNPKQQQPRGSSPSGGGGGGSSSSTSAEKRARSEH